MKPSKSDPGRRGPRTIRRRRGSAILLLCIITLPLILIMSTLVQGARHQAHMLDVERALSAQVQARLASFNKSLYDEFGLMALAAGSGSEAFTRLLPAGSEGVPLSQSASDPLSDPAILKSGILSYMRLRLPASLLDTFLDQTGIRAGHSAKPAPKAAGQGSGQPSAGVTFLRNEASRLILLPRHAADPGTGTLMKVGWLSDLVGNAREFIDKARKAVSDLLSEAIYSVLDREVQDALRQFRRFQAECATEGDGQQSIELPDLFDPEALNGFTGMISSAMTVPPGGFYSHVALREYILATFLPAGQPGQGVTAVGAGIRLSGEHLAFRNLSGNKITEYPGREPGELEQILIGTRSPKTAVNVIKAILIVYRAALYIGRKVMDPNAFAPYRLTAAGAVGALAAATGGAALAIPTDVIAYVLLACDGIRQGFSDYSKLMHGERLSIGGSSGSPKLALDYTMHLRIFAQLIPERRLLERAGAVIARRHSGVLATRITAGCTYLGQMRSRTGSLITIGATG